MKLLFILLFLVSCNSKTNLKGTYVVKAGNRVLTCVELFQHDNIFSLFGCTCFHTGEYYPSVFNVTNVIIKELK